MLAGAKPVQNYVTERVLNDGGPQGYAGGGEHIDLDDLLLRSQRQLRTRLSNLSRLSIVVVCAYGVEGRLHGVTYASVMVSASCLCRTMLGCPRSLCLILSTPRVARDRCVRRTTAFQVAYFQRQCPFLRTHLYHLFLACALKILL